MLRVVTLASIAALARSFAVPPMRTPSARAAVKPTVTNAAPLVLPTVPELALAAGVPTALGLWRTGFAVSYGYGGAIAASAYLYLQKTSGVAKLHATALAFYGVRLCAYLLLRGATTEMRPIKAKSASVTDRLKRLPLLAGCAALYAFLAAPLRVTAAGQATDAVKLLVKASFASFGVAAVALVLVHIALMGLHTEILFFPAVLALVVWQGLFGMFLSWRYSPRDLKKVAYFVHAQLITGIAIGVFAYFGHMLLDD